LKLLLFSPQFSMGEMFAMGSVFSVWLCWDHTTHSVGSPLWVCLLFPCFCFCFAFAFTSINPLVCACVCLSVCGALCNRCSAVAAHMKSESEPLPLRSCSIEFLRRILMPPKTGGATLPAERENITTFVCGSSIGKWSCSQFRHVWHKFKHSFWQIINFNGIIYDIYFSRKRN